MQQADVAHTSPLEPGDMCSSGAVLYLGGTMLIKNSIVCGAVTSDGTNGDFAGWNPNINLFVIAAYSHGGQVPTGTGIQIVSSTFQGALYARHAINATTTSKAQGPMVSESEVMIGQANGVDFPDITITPIGMPAFGPAFYTTLDPDYG